jgi:FkbM family methyltransferase
MEPTSLARRIARRALRVSGLAGLAGRYRRRFGWAGSGTLAGMRVCDPALEGYALGTAEPSATRVCQQVVRPGWTCVDVGAHRGYFTLLLASLSGDGGRVFSFEAHPENARTVARHVALNRLAGRVRVENVAVSDGSAAELTLFHGRPGSSFEWNIIGRDVFGQPTEAALTVPARALDGYFPAGERIDFVKVDAEGAEAQILAGMGRIIRESRPIALVEFHTEEGWAGRRELVSAGYDLFDVDAGEWVDAERPEPVYQCLAVPRERAAELPL